MNGLSIVPTSTLMAPTDFSANLSPDALMAYLTTRLDGLDGQINTIFNQEKHQQDVQAALRELRTEVTAFDDNAADDSAVDPAKLQKVQDALQSLKTIDPDLGAKVEHDLQADGFLLSGDSSSAPPPSPVAPAIESRGLNPPDQTGDAGPIPVDGTYATVGWGDNPTGPTGAGGATSGANGTPTASAAADDAGSDPVRTNTHFSGAEVKATEDYLDGLTKDIESESQMNMIHLQSLMSSRQTAIQLATNMISALGESSKAIAANIGR